MDPDRAAPNTGDNLTAARDFLARAAMQLDNVTTGGRARDVLNLIMMITPDCTNAVFKSTDNAYCNV